MVRWRVGHSLLALTRDRFCARASAGRAPAGACRHPSLGAADEVLHCKVRSGDRRPRRSQVACFALRRAGRNQRCFVIHSSRWPGLPVVMCGRGSYCGAGAAQLAAMGGGFEQKGNGESDGDGDGGGEGEEGEDPEDPETSQIWSAVSRMAQMTLLGAGASASNEWGEGGKGFEEEASFRVAL